MVRAAINGMMKVGEVIKLIEAGIWFKDSAGEEYFITHIAVESVLPKTILVEA